MSNDPQESGLEQTAATPSTEELQEPSTEKDPGEEPKAPKPAASEPDHHAVGIGVVGGPQVDPQAVDEDAAPSDRQE